MTSIGGQQIFQSGGQQYLIVNKALGGSGGRIQIVDQAAQDSASAAKFRREILARQPSYCKILNDLAGNDLKEVESSESEDTEISGEATGLVSKQEKEEPEPQGQAREALEAERELARRGAVLTAVGRVWEDASSV